MLHLAAFDSLDIITRAGRKGKGALPMTNRAQSETFAQPEPVGLCSFSPTALALSWVEGLASGLCLPCRFVLYYAT